ncbi:hypothetical protein GCM10011339_38300 [Echinicola rosea]|uniref:Uncharacterized protein n=1 Tax=Echinicola rosea TaxID=1807691 RepID=A0ABQ1V9E9_9BACT|nr:hypothetical protein GCM10011339_38300 [Echinicola rosea]
MKENFMLLNPLYALGIVMRAETTRKSGCLEIESSAAADQVAIDRLVHNAGSMPFS